MSKLFSGNSNVILERKDFVKRITNNFLKMLKSVYVKLEKPPVDDKTIDINNLVLALIKMSDVFDDVTMISILYRKNTFLGFDKAFSRVFYCAYHQTWIISLKSILSV